MTSHSDGSSARQEIYKAMREGQDKYTYFLLAGADAAIAFKLPWKYGDSALNPAKGCRLSTFECTVTVFTRWSEGRGRL